MIAAHRTGEDNPHEDTVGTPESELLAALLQATPSAAPAQPSGPDYEYRSVPCPPGTMRVRVGRRWWMLGLVSSLLLASLILFTAGGHAGATTFSAPTNLAGTDLGLSSVSLAGPSATYELALPAEPFVKWTAIGLTVSWPAQAASGTLVASDSEGRLATLNSGPDPAQSQQWVVPLRAQVDQTYVITLASSLLFPGAGNKCGQVDEDATVSVDPGLLQYESAGGPQSVGSYLSGPISALVIRVPDHPDHTVMASALQMESSLVARDIDRNVSVRVEPQANPISTPSLLTRVITISPATRGGVAISDDPALGLVVSGSDVRISNETRLLESNLAPLLVQQDISAVRVPGVTQNLATRLSLRQLGLGAVTASGDGAFSLPLSFDQAATGREIDALSFDLSGTSQLPAQGTSATVSLFNGAVPVASSSLGSGTWRIAGALGPTTITRDLDLSLRVNYFGGVGSCSTLLPIAVSVSPGSTVTVTPGVTEGEPGFNEMPQMFYPSAQVVLSDQSVTQLQLAAQLIAGMQRMTTTSLSLTLADSGRLPPAGTPAIVVCRSGSALARTLQPAAVANGSALFARSSGRPVTVNPDETILAAGHALSGQPVVALIVNGAQPSSGRDLLSAVGSEADNWFALTGDTAALGPDGVVVTAQVAGSTVPTTAQALHAWFGVKWVLIAGAAVALILVVAALFAWSGRRSRGKRGAPATTSDHPG